MARWHGSGIVASSPQMFGHGFVSVVGIANVHGTRRAGHDVREKRHCINSQLRVCGGKPGNGESCTCAGFGLQLRLHMEDLARACYIFVAEKLRGR